MAQQVDKSAEVRRCRLRVVACVARFGGGGSESDLHRNISVGELHICDIKRSKFEVGIIEHSFAVDENLDAVFAPLGCNMAPLVEGEFGNGALGEHAVFSVFQRQGETFLDRTVFEFKNGVAAGNCLPSSHADNVVGINENDGVAAGIFPFVGFDVEFNGSALADGEE